MNTLYLDRQHHRQQTTDGMIRFSTQTFYWQCHQVLQWLVKFNTLFVIGSIVVDFKIDTKTLLYFIISCPQSVVPNMECH